MSKMDEFLMALSDTQCHPSICCIMTCDYWEGLPVSPVGQAHFAKEKALLSWPGRE